MLKFLMPLAVVAAIAVPSAQAQVVTIKLGHVTQTTHPFHMGAEMFRDAVSAKTAGQVKIDIYPARQLGDDRQLLEGVRLGTVDAAVISSSTFSLFTPIMDGLQLPWLIASYDRLAEAFVSPPAQEMLGRLDGLGMKGLGYFEGGQRHMLNSRRPGDTLADWQGLKVRVVPNPLHIAIFKAVGASPTPMPYGEVYTALETGVLDGSEINVSSVYAEKFYEKASNLSLSGHFFFPGVVVINKARFAKLSADQQKALVSAALEAIKPQVKATENQEKDYLAKLKPLGLKVTPFKDRESAVKRVKAISDEYEAKDPLIKKFADQVRKSGN